MGATVRQRGPRSWLVTVHWQGEREFKTVHSAQDAKDLKRFIDQQEILGRNVIEAIRAARAEKPATTSWPMLRTALPEFITRMVATDVWTGSTPLHYAERLAYYVYDFVLPDGRRLGDVPVDQVTGAMLGAAIEGREGHRPGSRSAQDQICNPLRRYYRALRKTPGYPGENPTLELADYCRPRPSVRARQGKFTVFEQEEGPALFATCAAAYPRWLAFIGCCTLAGLRWGEAAGLERPDVDLAHGVLHVQRTYSHRTRTIKPCKDHEDRYVPLSPQLAAWLTAHWAMVAPAQVGRPLVFPSAQGRYLSYRDFRMRVWRHLLQKAGLRYRKPHSMRHTFATWALEGNEERKIPPAPILVVRDWMGHASVQETEGYLHRDRARRARATHHHLDAYVQP